MLFKALTLSCQCGRPPLRIKEIGLTADHELAVYWHCAACKRPVYAVKPLTECWTDCPKDETSSSPLLLSAPADPGSHDREFLRSLGVEPDPECGSA
jgi:hypothetical protein